MKIKIMRGKGEHHDSMLISVKGIPDELEDNAVDCHIRNLDHYARWAGKRGRPPKGRHEDIVTIVDGEIHIDEEARADWLGIGLENIGKIEPYLKPCPFCGGKATISDAGGQLYGGFVVCNCCAASSGRSRYLIDSIKHWNRRSDGED